MQERTELGTLPIPARIVLIGTFFQVVVGIFAIGPALPAIQAAVGHDPDALIGAPLVGSIAGLTFALTSLLWGGRTKRVGYRRVLLWALTVTTIAGLAGAAWANMPFILFTRAIVGAAVALSINASLFAVGSIFPERQRPRVLSLMALAGSASGLILFPTVATLSAIYWRLAFVPHLLASLAIPMVLSLPYLPPAALSVSKPAKAGRLGFDLIGAAALGGIVNFIVGVFGSTYLVRLGVANPLVLSLPAMLAAAGTMMGAAASVEVNRLVSCDACFAIVLTCFAGGLGVAGMTTQVPIFLVGAITAAFGVGVLGPSLNAAAILRSPQNPGPTLGLATGVLYGSMVLFPLIAVPLGSAIGGISRAILGVATVSILAALLFATRARRSAARSWKSS